MILYRTDVYGFFWWGKKLSMRTFHVYHLATLNSAYCILCRTRSSCSFMLWHGDSSFHSGKFSKSGCVILIMNDKSKKFSFFFFVNNVSNECSCPWALVHSIYTTQTLKCCKSLTLLLSIYEFNSHTPSVCSDNIPVNLNIGE